MRMSDPSSLSVFRQLIRLSFAEETVALTVEDEG